jgi:cytochrome c peroxidase
LRRLLLPLAIVLLTPVAALAADITLRDQCPASFQMLGDGTCKLVTLYDLYDSPAQHGGLKARLETRAARYTPAQMDLGRYLFFDPVLSADRTMSCATCHDPAKGLSDGLKRAMGRVELKRSTPSLWNVAFNSRFMWDGRAHSLEQQAILPLTSPDEMGNTPEGIVSSLNEIPVYRDLFRQAFGRSPDMDGVKRALAAFETTLVSLNSRYDRYAHGDETALSPREIRGHNVFRGFVARCSQCHLPPLFTDNELVVVGAPVDDRAAFDPGAGGVTDKPDLIGAFKVPTLRNISRTAPYFNAGQFETLEDVVGFYNDTRGHAAPPGQKLEIHWHVHMTNGPELSERDVADLAAFLATLEDETMMPEIPHELPSGLTHPEDH